MPTPSSILSIKKRPTKDGGFWCAPVVSKKVAKSAVVRNKIKRRIREAARAYEKTHPAPPTVFVYARAEAVRCSFAHLQHALFGAMAAHR